MCCALVYCLVVDLIISVSVSVGLLFHDVELDVGGKAAKGFPEQQCLAAEARRCITCSTLTIVITSGTITRCITCSTLTIDTNSGTITRCITCSTLSISVTSGTITGCITCSTLTIGITSFPITRCITCSALTIGMTSGTIIRHITCSSPHCRQHQQHRHLAHDLQHPHIGITSGTITRCITRSALTIGITSFSIT